MKSIYNLINQGFEKKYKETEEYLKEDSSSVTLDGVKKSKEGLRIWEPDDEDDAYWESYLDD